MALNTLKCNHLTPLGLKGLRRWLLGAGFSTMWIIYARLIGCNNPRRLTGL